MSEQDQLDYAEAEAAAERWRDALRRIADRLAPVIDPVHLDVMRGALDAAHAMMIAAEHDHVVVASVVHRQDVADGYA